MHDTLAGAFSSNGHSSAPGTRRRQDAAAGCARQCPSGGRAGGKHRQGIGRSATPFTRRTNKAAMPFTRRTNKAATPFTRRTTSAGSAANECEGITSLWQVTRNGSDEAERSERSPPGVARNAGDEGLAAPGGQVSGEAAPASGSASQSARPPPPARGSGGRARRPPEPSAGRRSGAHYPPGTLPVLALKSCYPPGTLHVLALKSCYPPGTLPVLVAMQSSDIKLTRDLKAEINLRTPRRPPGITGIVPTDCRRPGMKKSPVLWNFPF